MTAPAPALARRRLSVLADETRKIGAFFRRDLLSMWSYRLAFFMGWGGLLVQVVMFFFVDRIVDPDSVPSYGDEPTSYLAFVAVGIAITSFLAVSLGRIVSAIRGEQLMGTLESLLMTPTSFITVQLGSVIYDLAFVPARMALFLTFASILFGVHLAPGGLLPAAVVLVGILPFVWGAGILSAAGVLTLRKGASSVTMIASSLVATSGTYFPVDVFPSWLADATAAWNPITITLEAARSSLLGGAGWAPVLPALVRLVPMGAAALVIGVIAFQLALRRERRLGTLGLY